MNPSKKTHSQIQEACAVPPPLEEGPAGAAVADHPGRGGRARHGDVLPPRLPLPAQRLPRLRHLLRRGAGGFNALAAAFGARESSWCEEEASVT